MKLTTLLYGFAASVAFAACSSTTMIQSSPTNAKLYINEEYIGTTPYEYKDSKINGSITDVRLEKEGYEPFTARLYRNEQINGATAVGGLVVWPLYLWVMEYKTSHTYLLRQLAVEPSVQNNIQAEAKSNVSYLADIQALLSSNVITASEFETYRKRLLNNSDVNNQMYEGLLCYSKLKSNTSILEPDLFEFKSKVLSNKISITQIAKVKNYYDVFLSKGIDEVQFKKEVHFVIWGTNFSENEDVSFTWNEKVRVDKILKLKDGSAVVQYTEQYLLRDSQEIVEIPLNAIKQK